MLGVLRGGFLGVAALLIAALAGATSAEARYASIVIDAQSGRVLHETNADTRNYPASLTKMMTLYMTFEALESGKLELEQQLRVSRRAAGMSPSRLGLRRGSKITVKNAILGLVTRSANDAAVVLAEALAKNERQFARDMTRKAREIGMSRTTFRNASGLPNRGQTSTARDMALLSRALIDDHPQYYHYFSTKSFRYGGRRHRNHNRLLSRYRGTDGLKTGYIRASGFNIAVSAVRENRRLIAVVFGGRSQRHRDRHVAKLLDRAFAKAGPLLVAKASPPPPPPAKPSFEALLARVAGEGAGDGVGGAAETAAPAEQLVVAKALPAPAEPKPGIDTVAGRPVTDAAAPPPRPEPSSRDEAASETVAAAGEAEPGNWAVQVGAYFRYGPAKQAASKARGEMPELLGQSEIRVSYFRNKRGRRVYRARLVGLREDVARRVCESRQVAEKDCLVVQVYTRVASAEESPRRTATN